MVSWPQGAVIAPSPLFPDFLDALASLAFKLSQSKWVSDTFSDLQSVQSLQSTQSLQSIQIY